MAKKFNFLKNPLIFGGFCAMPFVHVSLGLPLLRFHLKYSF